MSTRKDGPRPAVIGTCTFRQVAVNHPGELLSRHLELIDSMVARSRALGGRLDLAILPEASSQFHRDGAADVAEDLDGPTVTAVADRARKHGIYATAPAILRRDGKVYNSVVLVDRGGDIIGVYEKVFPVMMADGSLEYGITPARKFPVFDLDFGRVGVQICWDGHFDEGWQALADQDTELVIYCTNPAVPVSLRGFAWRHGYYIASSTTHPPGVIVNPTGRVLATTTADGQVLVEKIDLDYRVLHSNCMWKWNETRAKPYEGRVNIEWDVDGHEYLVTSNDPTLPVRRFLETEGLLTGRQRERRNLELLRDAREGPIEMPEPVTRD